MKYHQSNQKETAIYLLLPWEGGRESKNSEVMASPGPADTGGLAWFFCEWGGAVRDPALVTHLNSSKALQALLRRVLVPWAGGSRRCSAG